MKRKLSIAFSGSSLVTAYWNGAATCYRGIIKYLNRLVYTGSCIITDYLKGIESFLVPGEEILVAESGDDIISHPGVTDRKRAVKIGDAAMKKVLADHTYKKRAILPDSILG